MLKSFLKLKFLFIYSTGLIFFPEHAQFDMAPLYIVLYIGVNFFPEHAQFDMGSKKKLNKNFNFKKLLSMF